MSVFLKIGFGVLGVTGIFLGGYILHNVLSTTWQPLSAEKAKYEHKYAGEYKPNLTGLADSNNRWWSEAFRGLKKVENITTKKFKDLKEEGKTYEDLKNVCREIYKSESSSVALNVNEGDDTKYKESEVWRFCSPAKVIGDSDYEPGSYGVTEKDYLASIRGNELFWKQRLEELKKEPGSTTPTPSLLKKLNLQSTTVVDLKNACHEAYKSPATNEQYPKADVFKYCSILGKESNS